MFLSWRYTTPDGNRAEQREAFEVKTQRPGDANPLRKAMTQLDGYLNHLGLTSGYIVLFDQRPQKKKAAEDLLTTEISPSGHTVTVARIRVPPGPGQPSR
jgi:hypothetical protein